jgi:2-aminoethylphosphonate-pyruvate transaminase
VSDRQWILLNPGPANTSREVREALVTPDLCHREPEFFEVMRDCRERLVRLAEGGDGFAAVLFTGSGTAAVEAAVCSAVPADGGLLVVDNGVYGERLLRIARAHGIPTRALSYDVTTAARPDDVRAALRAEPQLTHVAVVHHETTTGVLNPVAEIVRAAAVEGRRVLVDAMSSLFGEPLDVTQDGIDFVMASASKCLQGYPASRSCWPAGARSMRCAAGRRGASIWISRTTTWRRSRTTRPSRPPCRCSTRCARR